MRFLIQRLPGHAEKDLFFFLKVVADDAQRARDAIGRIIKILCLFYLPQRVLDFVMLGPHLGKRATRSHMRLERGKKQFLLQICMRQEHGTQDRRGLPSLGDARRRGCNGFDSIENRVENSMLAKQGVGQLHGLFPSFPGRSRCRQTANCEAYFDVDPSA